MIARDPSTITCDDLQAEIDRHSRLGYRLDMIMPADLPRLALLSNGDHKVQLMAPEIPRSGVKDPQSKGRAGMMYRDLIPHRLGGKVIASHIRIIDGGEVPDSVHYHKTDFQVIYCLRGAIRVVYEDQGPPFWLRPGDCVLQPPEIRHRVLEAEACSEVIEITSPAEHETWFDHEMELPTRNLRPERLFGTQRFVRHLDADALWQSLDDGETMAASTEIAAAGIGSPDVRTLKLKEGGENLVEHSETNGISLKLVVNGRGISVTYD